MINRRDALKQIGGFAGAATLARYLSACNSGPTGIKNYVFMMMENRTYDHYFGARSMLEGLPGNGLQMSMTNPDTNGNPVSLYVPSTTDSSECVMDPDHSWTGSRMEWDAGKNDGFVKQQESAYGIGHHEPMQYMTRDLLPVSWALADAYTTCDAWFASVMGPTWPNRFYWMCATSGGLMDNTLPTGGVNFPLIFNSLHDKNIDWAYYYGSIPVVAAFDPPMGSPNYLDVLPNVKRFSQFLDDAVAGKLPSVTYIDPYFYGNDDHPPIHPINGQALIASVYTALAKSPQWKNTLFVLTYDEHGGFFDHVSPPTTVDPLAAQGFSQCGFRVPAMVMGPYAKAGNVSSVQYDHCSALAHLERTFDLTPLNTRTMAANDLTDCIDMERLSKGDWAKPIEVPTIDPTTWTMGSPCTYTGSGLRKDPISAWADQYPERVRGLDLRGEVEDYERVIKTFLRDVQRTLVVVPDDVLR
jgi:phospholipase C